MPVDNQPKGELMPNRKDFSLRAAILRTKLVSEVLKAAASTSEALAEQIRNPVTTEASDEAATQNEGPLIELDEVLQKLREALQGSDPEIAAAAAQTIGLVAKRTPKIAGAMDSDVFALTDDLVAAVHQTEGEVRAAAVEALGCYGPYLPADVVKVIAKRLCREGQEPCEGTRLKSIAALCCVTRDRVAVEIDALCEALEDPVAEIRKKAAMTLASLGRDALLAVDALVSTAIQDEDCNVQIAAARALASIGCIDEVLDRIKDRDSQQKLIRVLSDVGEPGRSLRMALQSAERFEKRRFSTLAEIAEYLKMTQRTVQRRCKAKNLTLKDYKKGKCYELSEVDLNKLREPPS